MNIDLTTNFNQPYFSVSPPDFWSRWHISLSTWFRDYVYVPLARRGGRKPTNAHLYLTLIIVMLLSGLWHGAAWTFVLWGLYHGLLLVGFRLVSLPRMSFFRKTGSKLGATTKVAQPRVSSFGYLWRVVLMFHLICLGWLLFRADSLTQAWQMLARIGTDFRWTPLASSSFAMILFFAGPLMAYEFWLEKRQDLLSLTKVNWRWRGLVYSYCALMLWVFPPPVSNVFIYFQF
jgi:D-alanyl-lipoteichoic acid acyltransferase DltB (MBOAT superfamily)